MNPERLNSESMLAHALQDGGQRLRVFWLSSAVCSISDIYLVS
ncbi:hypothetical protein PA08_2710 [Cutibacterium modestum P08]|nr:hypothetical protein PA08_2710 [Cutibacterium modestum P08]